MNEPWFYVAVWLVSLVIGIYFTRWVFRVDYQMKRLDQIALSLEELSKVARDRFPASTGSTAPRAPVLSDEQRSMYEALLAKADNESATGKQEG